MEVWATLEHLVTTASTVERPTMSEGIVAQIADALAVAGEYATWVDVEPTQHVVDFNWAAHQAGRRLGIRIHVEVEHAKEAADGRVVVRVTAQRPLG
jgi:hypothetical protein